MPFRWRSLAVSVALARATGRSRSEFSHGREHKTRLGGRKKSLDSFPVQIVWNGNTKPQIQNFRVWSSTLGFGNCVSDENRSGILFASGDRRRRGTVRDGAINVGGPRRSHRGGRAR